MSRPLYSLIVPLLALALALPLAAPAAAGPAIAFDKTELVFSDVREGKDLTAVFPFANTGDQNLLISEVNPSCGCTVAEYTKAVEPGQKGEVRLILDTNGITGQFRKTAVVATNDRSNPFVTLVMLGETISRIKVDKGRRLDLVGCQGQEVANTATLTHPDGEAILLTGIENPMKPYLTASLEPGADRKSYKLHLKANSAEPVEFAGPLYLLSPGQPKVSIWVVVDVRGPFKVQPSEVYFGGVSRAQAAGQARSILVRKACADKLSVQNIDYDTEMFKVESHWQKPGEEMLLVVTPKAADLPKGPFESTLSIRSGDKLYPVKLKGTIY